MTPPPELVGYSLAQQANPGAENPDYLLYFIHDIVLDYLADTVPTHKQVCVYSACIVHMNRPYLLHHALRMYSE